MHTSDDRIIRLPPVDSKANYLAGFWQWVELLAAKQYQAAVDALYWPTPTSWTGELLQERVETFFGGNEPWSVVVPNARLIGVIEDAATFDARAGRERGWFMAMIPLTTKPDDPKDDAIPLMGLATSFFVWPSASDYVLEFEIFHV